MIKTQTNPELLNDLRKLCKGVKEIHIDVSHWTEGFDYLDDNAWFYDADGNEIVYEKIKDTYDALFDFDLSLHTGDQDSYNRKKESINWRLHYYLIDLYNASGICLYGIWWLGRFILDLDNGVITLIASNCENPDEIEYELESDNYLSKEEIEEYLKDLPDFYYDKNKEQSKKFAPYGYPDDYSLVPIVKFLMCSEIE